MNGVSSAEFLSKGEEGGAATELSSKEGKEGASGWLFSFITLNLRVAR
jgi:hypothetical protein